METESNFDAIADFYLDEVVEIHVARLLFLKRTM